LGSPVRRLVTRFGLTSLVVVAAVAGAILGRTAADPAATQAAWGAWLTADVGAGVNVTYPRTWQLLAPPITSMIDPSERLLLTSYPTAPGGECAPRRAQDDLPAAGALIYVFEYERPQVWGDFRPRDFPPKPAHFSLQRKDLGDYECWLIPTYLLRFRAAGHVLQIHVALGRRAGVRRRAQVLRILDNLRFTRGAW
jgi:hypothetical protein